MREGEGGRGREREGEGGRGRGGERIKSEESGERREECVEDKRYYEVPATSLFLSQRGRRE